MDLTLFPGKKLPPFNHLQRRVASVSRVEKQINPRLRLWVSILVVAATLSCGHASAEEGFENWNLEAGLSQAQLVLVVRVSAISRLTVVEGAKTDVAMREYRFQPVRRLKGLYQRDQLSMTAADLGNPADDATQSPPLKEGEFRLLILAQQRGSNLGCVSAALGATTFDERVPRLTGPDDPLVAVVDTLIQVADARSRQQRTKLLVEHLQTAEGLSAVPILSSLRLRVDWTAVDDRALEPLCRLSHSRLTAVRTAALEVLRGILANRILQGDAHQLDDVANTLRVVLDSDEPMTRVRLTAIEGMGHLLALKADIPWAHGLLIAQLTIAKTYAERETVIAALAHSAHPQAVAVVMETLAKLPLDELPARELAIGRAAVQLSRSEAEPILLNRLQQSISARQSLETEIELLGGLQCQECFPLLLAVAKRPDLVPNDRFHIAVAFGHLGQDQAAPVLVSWMWGNDFQLKERALTALENLDSPIAADEVRPLLKWEAHLPFKLRLARLVARHGISDGYALATEHLADVSHTAAATLVLAALKDARTRKDLSEIVAARPDRRWHAAALSGLAATGDVAARGQLLEILADDRNPLAVGAAEAAGVAADADLMRPLATLVQSRNKQIAMASLVAIRRFFADVHSSPRGLAAAHWEIGSLPPEAVDAPAETRAAIVSAVGSLLTDTYVDADVRREAFAVASLLKGEHYGELLNKIADQSELEGTPLLAAVESEIRRQRGHEK